jgi:hypothetical protein
MVQIKRITWNVVIACLFGITPVTAYADLVGSITSTSQAIGSLVGSTTQTVINTIVAPTLQPVNSTDLQGNPQNVFPNFPACQNKYVDGKYMCVQFSTDLQTQLGLGNFTAYRLAFGPMQDSHNGLPAKCDIAGHMENIVLMSLPSYMAPGSAFKYCVVEPQGGFIEYCWYQSGVVPVVPSNVVPALFTQFPDLNACYQAYRNNIYVEINDVYQIKPN